MYGTCEGSVYEVRSFVFKFVLAQCDGVAIENMNISACIGVLCVLTSVE